MRLIFWASLIVLASTPSKSDPVQKRVYLSKEQRSAVKLSVGSQLRDPSSAQFGGYRAGMTTGGTIVVCGFVNGTNGYGGFVGMSPFFGSFNGSEFKTLALESVRGERIVLKTCDDLGINPGEPKKPTR